MGVSTVFVIVFFNYSTRIPLCQLFFSSPFTKISEDEGLGFV